MSPWDTVEDDGGAELEGRWKAEVVFGRRRMGWMVDLEMESRTLPTD